MAYSIGGFQFNQSNVNKILAVAAVIYAAQMAFMTVSFMGHYFNEKSLAQRPDMLSFFARNMSIMLLAGGIAGWKHNTSFGVSFYNLVGQTFFLCHFLGLLFGGLYAEKLYADQKQMWQIQVCVNLIFVILAYLGFKDATDAGNANSDKTHTDANTSHKSIGSLALHQSNCNKFLGVCWFIYGVASVGFSEQFYLQYFSASAINFTLFQFWSRGVGLMFLATGLSSFLHCGSDGISLFNLVAMVLFLVQFLATLFGNLYTAALWEDQKQMWQIQTFISFIFFIVAYLGNKDANERASSLPSSAPVAIPAAAAAAAAPAKSPAGGSML